MKAVDTNILARALVRDDIRQAEIADALIAEGIFIPLTVMLETAWLLGSRYKVERSALADILSDIMDLPNVEVEQADGARWAVAQFRAGADIADAIHVLAANGAEAFVTFDEQAFRKLADPPVAIEVPR
ncbi:PIN domain nuclease [Sphingobium lactosutens]|uniref:type II toxin-antitoxin system VapC family toxin n=1 Tax=Sphingobium lactosutens TaxID=522773 RepID=UPI0015BFF232|nr:type II toxin-antitoxin system VapC family toxin [Sphingobium lactosutens]NWK98110.1 PIN domain nuclease [Sphingobium lactosutens]